MVTAIVRERCDLAASEPEHVPGLVGELGRLAAGAGRNEHGWGCEHTQPRDGPHLVHEPGRRSLLDRALSCADRRDQRVGFPQGVSERHLPGRDFALQPIRLALAFLDEVTEVVQGNTECRSPLDRLRGSLVRLPGSLVRIRGLEFGGGDLLPAELGDLSARDEFAGYAEDQKCDRELAGDVPEGQRFAMERCELVSPTTPKRTANVDHNAIHSQAASDQDGDDIPPPSFRATLMVAALAITVIVVVTDAAFLVFRYARQQLKLATRKQVDRR